MVQEKMLDCLGTSAYTGISSAAVSEAAEQDEEKQMTSESEINDLVARVRATGATVEVTHDRELYQREGRWVTQFVQVKGLRGCGPHPMSVLTAAEVLRECLASNVRSA